MQTYFENQASRTLPVLIINILLAITGIVALVVTQQILMGWLAFGERADISRHDINNIEIMLALGSTLFGIAALRAAWGVYTQEVAGWAWSQWVALAGLVVAFAMGSSTLLASTQKGNDVDNQLFFGGFIIFVIFAIAYQYSTRNAETPPHQFFSIQLAETPSAGAIIGFIVILMGFSMATSLFYDPASVASILTNNATKGIVAIGITMLMISGEFDLSVGSVLGVTAMVFMALMTEGRVGLIILTVDFGQPLPLVWAAMFALMFASLLGLINGLVFTYTKIPSFIVTLGTLFAFRAISLVGVAGGTILRYKDYYDELPMWEIPHSLIAIGAFIVLIIVGYTTYLAIPHYWTNTIRRWQIRQNNGSFGTTTALASGLHVIVVTATLAVTFIWLALVVIYHGERFGDTLHVGAFDVLNGRWVFTLEQVTQPLEALGLNLSLAIPRNANFRMSIIWWVFMVVFFEMILVNTRYGNAVFAVGGNIGAAKAQGINASRVKIQNFVLCSFLAGVAGIFETARSPGVDPLKGESWELEAIAMTVIGGALLTGGYGRIVGTMLGVLIFGMLQTGLVLVGVDPGMFQGVIGVIMIVAVVLNNITKQRS